LLNSWRWVIVVMGKDHLPEILPALAANRKSPNLLFMGNNVSGGRDLATAVGRERLLMGFLMAVGKMDGPVACCASEFGERRSVSMVGELNGGGSARLVEIVAIFQNAGLAMEISPNIEAWLKCHAAIIVPLGGGYFLSGSSLDAMANTRDVKVMFLRGAREALQALQAYHIPILPSKLKIYLWLPEPLLLAIIDRILRNPQMSFALIHAGEVQPELRQLGCELTTLARRVNILTPHLDHLVLATMPQVRPVPEGSQELPLDWRGVWAAIGALAALTGLVYSCSLLKQRCDRK
jgi:2-dehydropantoate 2-reductase